MEAGEVIRLLQSNGGAVAVFVVGLLRRWWVMGPEFERELKDRQFWQAYALELLQVARKANETTERVVNAVSLEGSANA